MSAFTSPGKNQLSHPDEGYWIRASQILDGITKYFWAYAYIAFVIFGVFGNAVSVVIFFKRRRQDRASATYLGVLAVFDLVNACHGVNVWLYNYAPFVSSYSNLEIAASDLGCQMAVYTWLVAGFVSAWIIVTFSVERCLVVWFPLKMAPIVASSKPRVTSISVILALGCCVHISPMFYYIRSPSLFGDGRIMQCAPQPGTPTAVRVIYFYVGVTLNSALPCILVGFINILILMGVFHNRMDKSQKSTSCK